jgi:hypothetical protein
MSEPLPSASSPRDPTEGLKQQIDQTRAELADTVDALARKADVPSRTKDKIIVTGGQLRDKATATGRQVKDKATAAGKQAKDKAANSSPRTRVMAGAAAAGAVLLAIVLRRRRAS